MRLPTSKGVREGARERVCVTGAGKSQVSSFALRAQKYVQKTNDSVGESGDGRCRELRPLALSFSLAGARWDI
jgi:hypothetical protein